MNTTAGAVQVCTAWSSGGQQWRYISPDYWTNTTVKKACQQLGLGYTSKDANTAIIIIDNANHVYTNMKV